MRHGDTIAVVSPASAPQLDRLEAGIESLRGAGYVVKRYRDPPVARGYLAGSDDERVEELNAAIRDDEVKAIIAARGGYGLSRILDRVDYDALRARPKIVAGYSDLTALHAAIGRRAGVASFHSPHVVDGLGAGASCPVSAESFWQEVGGQSPSLTIESDRSHPDALKSDFGGGVAQGPLVGGNAAVLCAILGTPFEPELNGSLLLLEDTGEAAYRIDRLLSQLRLAGKLDGLAGVVLGYFSDLPKDVEEREALQRVFRDYLAPLGAPVLSGVPIGHATPNRTVALGVRYRIDADAGSLERIEPAVSG